MCWWWCCCLCCCCCRVVVVVGGGVAVAVAAVAAGGAGAQCGRIRARSGFGQTVAEYFGHRADIRQPFGAGFSRAKAINHAATHIVDRQKGSHRRAGHGQGFKHQRSIQTAQTRATTLFADINACQAQFGHFWPQIFWDCALPIPCQRMRGDMVLSKPVRHIENSVLFLGTCKVHCVLPFMSATKAKDYYSIISIVFPSGPQGGCRR